MMIIELPCSTVTSVCISGLSVEELSADDKADEVDSCKADDPDSD